MGQESFRECFWMLPVHEMPAWDFFDDVVIVEHPGGVPIVRGLRDGITEPRKDDRGHGDPRLQRCAGYRRELSVIAERRVQARPVREARPDRIEFTWIGAPVRRPSPDNR